MRCSLIVLNYQGEDVIERCVESLLAAMGARDELIVVENGSTDRSAKILARYADRVQLLQLHENTYIFGLNEGLDVARGEIVAFLNNDMTVEPDFVERCVQSLERAPLDVFAVCPRILQEDGEDQGSRTSGHWRRGLIFYEPLPHSAVPTDCFFAVGGQSFFRRESLQEIGSIDPLLWPMYHEDIELSYRAWKRGWRIRYVPEAVAHHLGGHTSERVFSAADLRTFVRQNEFLTVWKNITDPRLIATHLLLLPARLVAATLKRDWPTLRGFGRASMRLPAALRARREARRHASHTDSEVLVRVGSIV